MKKRISPPRITDDEIKKFAPDNQCTIVDIIRKTGNDGHSRLYITYAKGKNYR